MHYIFSTESLVENFQAASGNLQIEQEQNPNQPEKKENFIASNIPGEFRELRRLLESLHDESDNEIRCQTTEKAVQIILEDEIDTDILSTLVSSLSQSLLSQIDSIILPGSLNDESLIDSISNPLFVMFRNQFHLCKEDDHRKKKLTAVLFQLQMIQPKVGYLLLYFLKVWSKEEEKREYEQRSVKIV